MNVKETMELINYLKDRKDLAFTTQQRYESYLEDPEEEARKEFYEKCRSECGQEVTWLIYMIRLLEGLEVAR